jgi:LmbE family N-acetylglucosaminyl deacetylase
LPSSVPSSLSGRVVVISPHVDDAVLSLAGTLARAARSGAEVEVLTIFALDPASEEPANGWDTRAGFTTEGEAARARRDEDREACRLVGAEPTWLPFRGGGYTKERDPDAIWEAATAVLAHADSVVVPGFPLTNPDHAWISDLFTTRLSTAKLGLYAEQPYRYMVRRERPEPEPTPALDERASVAWTSTWPGLAGYRLKRKAIRAYASQLPLLGLASRFHRNLDLMLLHEAFQRGEAIAWVRSETRP